MTLTNNVNRRNLSRSSSPICVANHWMYKWPPASDRPKLAGRFWCGLGNCQQVS